MTDASTLARHGPWICPACDGASDKPYRCEHCGFDFAGKGATTGRESN